MRIFICFCMCSNAFLVFTAFARNFGFARLAWDIFMAYFICAFGVALVRLRQLGNRPGEQIAEHMSHHQCGTCTRINLFKSAILIGTVGSAVQII